MNEDILKGKWREIKGEVKATWGKITDDDMMMLEGKADKLVGVLQQKYGYTKEKAEEEIERLVRKIK